VSIEDIRPQSPPHRGTPSDLGRAHRLAAEVRAGVVWVNCFGTLDYGVPFGGFGQSGWGREHGVEGIELFSETKTVVAAL
jgi:phenylacetaldehyde dehydrogenase